MHFASHGPNTDARLWLTVPKSELGASFKLLHLYDDETQDAFRIVAFMQRLHHLLTGNINADLREQCVTIALPSVIFTRQELIMHIFRTNDGADVIVRSDVREARTPTREFMFSRSGQSRGGLRLILVLVSICAGASRICHSMESIRGEEQPTQRCSPRP